MTLLTHICGSTARANTSASTISMRTKAALWGTEMACKM